MGWWTLSVQTDLAGSSRGRSQGKSQKRERSVVYGLILGGTQDAWETFSCFLIQEEGAH